MPAGWYPSQLRRATLCFIQADDDRLYMTDIVRCECPRASTA